MAGKTPTARRKPHRAPAAAGRLGEYRRKRRFDETPEPAGDAPLRAAARRTSGDSFVVQKHAARRLHYDFRLELDGVLKSWAVAKGPSLDPTVRRLAIHVEDHPLDYGDFEGSIPAGQYGGGTVMVWDRGHWHPGADARRSYAAGKLKFTLDGERLKGGWTLVRMGGKAADEKHDNWLLIKERDRFARPGEGDRALETAKRSVLSNKTMEELAASGRVWQSARDEPDAVGDGEAKDVETGHSPASPQAAATAIGKRSALPDFIEPELATLVERPPTAADWVHEVKLDGYRVFCRRDGRDVRLLTRSGQDWTQRFAGLVAPLKGLPARRYALDGEVVVLDQGGISSFAALQEALSKGEQDRFVLFAFDLLHLDGRDLRGANLAERKRALEALLAIVGDDGPIRYSSHIDGQGADVFSHACRMALEGVVSKRGDRPYRSGRTRDWLKSKCVSRQEFVIIGFTMPSKPGVDAIGALALGYFEGERLVYAGRVGTGFSDEIRRHLRAELEKRRLSRPPIADLSAAARRGIHWVRPELVCEVEFTEWTTDGVLRHPSYQGLREDKDPQSIRRERPNAAPKPRAAAAMPRPGARRTPRQDEEVAGVAVSHADRIIFPDLGATKLELVEYYEAVGERMLQEIADRPLSLLRCPEGIGGGCFFQKHFSGGELADLPHVAIEERKGKRQYLFLRRVADLLELPQHGIVELHPWGARADNVDRPDRLVFDLDPDPAVPWADVVAAALAMREQLASLGLASFAKTTGGKGLHVVVPLSRQGEWAEAKEFARAVAASFVKASPDAFTDNPLKARRVGKIFIDYLRNDRGATAIAPYAVRARTGAPVAMPLDWSEVTPELDPNKFTLRTVPTSLAKARDPWRDMAKTKQRISAAARRALGLR